MDLTKYIANLAKKQPSEYLAWSEANNMYDTVPTPARDFIWLKKMNKVKYDDTTIKVTTYEPAYWTTKEVKPWATAPISDKLWVKSEKFITANREAESFSKKFEDLAEWCSDPLTLKVGSDWIHGGDAKQGWRAVWKAGLLARRMNLLKPTVLESKVHARDLRNTRNTAWDVPFMAEYCV